MADETTQDTADKPLNAEPKIDPPKPFLTTAGEPAQIEPASAVDRLRAFEDKHFGEKAVRINGRIERGSGSPFQMAHPSVRDHHGKIEKLIVAEEKLATAHTALIAADADHEQAEQAVADAEKDANDAPSAE